MIEEIKKERRWKSCFFLHNSFWGYDLRESELHMYVCMYILHMLFYLCIIIMITIYWDLIASFDLIRTPYEYIHIQTTYAYTHTHTDNIRMYVRMLFSWPSFLVFIYVFVFLFIFYLYIFIICPFYLFLFVSLSWVYIFPMQSLSNSPTLLMRMAPLLSMKKETR